MNANTITLSDLNNIHERLWIYANQIEAVMHSAMEGEIDPATATEQANKILADVEDYASRNQL